MWRECHPVPATWASPFRGASPCQGAVGCHLLKLWTRPPSSYRPSPGSFGNTLRRGRLCERGDSPVEGCRMAEQKEVPEAPNRQWCEHVRATYRLKLPVRDE